MKTKTALKWSVLYHVGALAAAVLGIVIAGAGLYVGLGGALGAVTLTDPGTYGRALGAASPLPAVAGVLVGLFVWRVGRTTARLKATAETVDSAVDVPSTSVLSRKVGREVSESVVEAVRTGGTDGVLEGSEAESEFDADDHGEEFGESEPVGSFEEAEAGTETEVEAGEFGEPESTGGFEEAEPAESRAGSAEGEFDEEFDEEFGDELADEETDSEDANDPW